MRQVHGRLCRRWPLAPGWPRDGYITTFRAQSMPAAKILVERRAQRTLFCHQEKSHQDLFLSWEIRCHRVSHECAGAQFAAEAANLDAFTETRWVTIRGDIAPYPF
jgi:hypothetical protein